MSERVLGRRFRQLLIRRIAAERGISVSDIVPSASILGPSPINLLKARNEWGDIGAIEVEYDEAGHHALYGFDALGNVSCYMD